MQVSDVTAIMTAYLGLLNIVHQLNADIFPELAVEVVYESSD